MPIIEDTVDATAKSRVHCLDLKDAFFHVDVDQERAQKSDENLKAVFAFFFFRNDKEISNTVKNLGSSIYLFPILEAKPPYKRVLTKLLQLF